MTAVFPKPFQSGFRLIDNTSLNALLANPQVSTEDTITAHAGGTKAAAYQLRATVSRITTAATAADSVLLPPSYAGAQFIIINAGAAAIQVFGTTTDTIDAIGAGTGVSQAAGTTVSYRCVTKGAWKSTNGTGLTTGAQTITGAKTFDTMPIIPSATVAATGTNQGTAAPITTGFTLVSAADGTVGVQLPTAVAGLQCIIKNNAAAVLKVYPFSGDGINAIAVNSALSMASLTSAVYVAYDATTWYTIPLLPS